MLTWIKMKRLKRSDLAKKDASEQGNSNAANQSALANVNQSYNVPKFKIGNFGNCPSMPVASGSRLFPSPTTTSLIFEELNYLKTYSLPLDEFVHGDVIKPSKLQVTQLLGEGAKGHVYECYDPQRNATFAVKIFTRPLQSDTDKGATEDSIYLLNKLKETPHPNLLGFIGDFTYSKTLKPEIELHFRCEIYKLMPAKSTLFDLYEYLQDEPFELDTSDGFDDFCKLNKNPISLPHLVRILSQIFIGINTLNKWNLIHGDLKAENTLIDIPRNWTPSQPIDFLRKGSAVKLTDYDTVRLKNGNSSNLICKTVEEEMGTLYTEAPEVMLGLPFDDKIDVWSAGATLVQYLIGSNNPPFDGLSSHCCLYLIDRRLGLVAGGSPLWLAETDSWRQEQYFIPEKAQLLTGDANDELKNSKSEHLKEFKKSFEVDSAIIQTPAEFDPAEGSAPLVSEPKMLKTMKELYEEARNKLVHDLKDTPDSGVNHLSLFDSVQCLLGKMLKPNPQERATVKEVAKEIKQLIQNHKSIIYFRDIMIF